MERPSHNVSTLILQPCSRRFAGLSLSIAAQLGFAAVLIGGIVDRVKNEPPPRPLEVTDIDKVTPQPPPPPIKVERPVLPTADKPIIDVVPDSSATPITTVVPQPAQTIPV